MNENRAIASEKQEVKKPEKGINLRIQDAKEDIATVINKTQLPPGILLMILNEFATQVQAQNAMAITQERKAYEEGVKKDGEEIHKN